MDADGSLVPPQPPSVNTWRWIERITNGTRGSVSLRKLVSVSQKEFSDRERLSEVCSRPPESSHPGVWLFIEHQFECVCLWLAGAVQAHVTTHSKHRVAITGRWMEKTMRRKNSSERKNVRHYKIHSNFNVKLTIIIFIYLLNGPAWLSIHGQWCKHKEEGRRTWRWCRNSQWNCRFYPTKPVHVLMISLISTLRFSSSVHSSVKIRWVSCVLQVLQNVSLP